MADIILGGNTYQDPPAVNLPIDGGGTQKFYDIDYANFGWMGAGLTDLGEIMAVDKTLSQTDFATWTPSTTASVILAAQTGTAVTLDLENYEYFTVWHTDIDVALQSGATKKAQVSRYVNAGFNNVHVRPYGISNFTPPTDSYNYATNLFTSSSYLFYWNTSGTLTWTTTSSYGLYISTWTAPTLSSTSSLTPKLTPKSPAISARCSSTYMGTTRAPEIDQANTTIRMRCRLYRVDRYTSPLRYMFHDALGIYNNPIPANT